MEALTGCRPENLGLRSNQLEPGYIDAGRDVVLTLQLQDRLLVYATQNQR